VIERVTHAERLLALVVRGGNTPEATTFVTPPDLNLQVGFVVYGAGEPFARHIHLPIERHIVGSMEVLIVQRGRCEVDFYTDERALVDTRELAAGDTLIAVGGGHGFRFLEDTVLLEVKQGPYPGKLVEKDLF
jgi:hypothetical protein